MRIELLRVREMPKELRAGVLYVSEEFGTAAHLCACGCGSKVRTPLGPPEWTWEQTDAGPSLFPSIGNWQLPCQSHYWIRRGSIVWSEKWTREEIEAGRQEADERRLAYYEALNSKPGGPLRSIWRSIKSAFE